MNSLDSLRPLSLMLGSFIVGSAFLWGCGDPDQMPNDQTSGAENPNSSSSEEQPSVCNGGEEIVITDETNYSFSNTLDVQHTTLKDATDLTFEWGGITTDLFGHQIDAKEEIDMLLVALLELTPEQIEEQLKFDGNLTGYNKGAISTYPDGSFTSENLLDFTLLGEEITDEEIWQFFDTSTENYMFDPETHTFIVMAQTGTEPGKNARMLHMFSLDPEAEQTTLTLTDDSTTVDYEVELEDAAKVPVPSETADLVIQWDQMTTTSLGNEFEPTQVTEVAVAHYSMTREELEANFLDLENLADGWWDGEVEAGTSINLTELTNEGGTSFPGIDSDGLWVVATFCTRSCNNPAPWSLTFVEPCSAE